MTEMRITDGKGVHFSFDNGITISIQIGGGNYSENYNEPIGRYRQGDDYSLPPSSTAEIAAWDKDNKWIDIDGDNVKGYVQLNDVLRFMSLLQSLPSDLEKAEIELSTNAFVWSR